MGVEKSPQLQNASVIFSVYYWHQRFTVYAAGLGRVYCAMYWQFITMHGAGGVHCATGG